MGGGSQGCGARVRAIAPPSRCCPAASCAAAAALCLRRCPAHGPVPLETSSLLVLNPLLLLDTHALADMPLRAGCLTDSYRMLLTNPVCSLLWLDPSLLAPIFTPNRALPFTAQPCIFLLCKATLQGRCGEVAHSAQARHVQAGGASARKGAAVSAGQPRFIPYYCWCICLCTSLLRWQLQHYQQCHATFPVPAALKAGRCNESRTAVASLSAALPHL